MCVCLHVCAPNCVSLNFKLGGPSNQHTDMVLQNYHISASCAVLAVHFLLCLHTALSLLTASAKQSLCVSVYPLHSLYVMCTMQGNYDAYVRVRAELEENQMKKYQWEQDQTKHMKMSESLGDE